MNNTTIIKSAEVFIKEVEMAAVRGEKVSAKRKNSLLTSLGTLFLKGVPYESFKKTYEKLDKVSNIA
ncbi:MAG TPA: hypothetical protein PK507_03780 [bacterium]|nr:hypothetical protein [bacterium]